MSKLCNFKGRGEGYFSSYLAAPPNTIIRAHTSTKRDSHKHGS